MSWDDRDTTWPDDIDVPEKSYCEFVGTITAETDKAFLIVFEEGTRMTGVDIWIPKSQMVGLGYEHGFSGDIRIKKFILEKKGII